MALLALDTCFGACSAAVLDIGAGSARDLRTGSVRAAACERMRTGHAERLIPMVADVMAAAGLDFGALDGIAVSSGPGTFTGMRVGIAAARGFALAAGQPALAMSSLSLIAAEAASTLSPAGVCGGLVVAMDAGRGEVYVQCFAASESGSVRALDEPRLLEVVDAAALLPESVLLAVGSGGAAIAAAAATHGRSPPAWVKRD
jgi:tRNA threonylcarbamoyladenosine biosynthesis protein TsaB